MVLLAVISAVLLGLSVVLAARAVVLPRLHSADRIRAIDHYGFHAAAPVAATSAGQTPAFAGAATRIGQALGPRLSGVRPELLRRELVAAGFYKLTPAALIGYRVIAAVGLGLFWLVVSSGGAGPLLFLYTAFGAAVGWRLPLFFVHRTATNRLARIDRELPNVIDFVVVTVEAGTGLSGSLQLAADKLQGPLGDELKLTLQEQRMGRSTREALLSLLNRCDTPNMRAFVRSVVQGEELGVSIGVIMRNLAAEMRKRRRAAAETQAQKAPVKILFPLVFLILPAFLIVVLAPALFQFLDTF